jgi:hypothetical protein
LTNLSGFTYKVTVERCGGGQYSSSQFKALDEALAWARQATGILPRDTEDSRLAYKIIGWIQQEHRS